MARFRLVSPSIFMVKPFTFCGRVKHSFLSSVIGPLICELRLNCSGVIPEGVSSVVAAEAVGVTVGLVAVASDEPVVVSNVGLVAVVDAGGAIGAVPVAGCDEVVVSAVSVVVVAGSFDAASVAVSGWTTSVAVPASDVVPVTVVSVVGVALVVPVEETVVSPVVAAGEVESSGVFFLMTEKVSEDDFFAISVPWFEPIAVLGCELKTILLLPMTKQKRKAELRMNSRHREKNCFTLIFFF